MINITVPFDCDIGVFLLSNEDISSDSKIWNYQDQEEWTKLEMFFSGKPDDPKKFIRKIHERGNSTFSFIQKFEKLPNYLFWNLKFRHNDVDTRKFNFLKEYPHETTDDCRKCIENKEELRAGFYEEMKKLTSFRGHGRINAENSYFTYDVKDWEPFTNDEIMTLLKLIHLGIETFNFTLSSDTELDAEYKGIQLKTSSVYENW